MSQCCHASRPLHTDLEVGHEIFNLDVLVEGSVAWSEPNAHTYPKPNSQSHRYHTNHNQSEDDETAQPFPALYQLRFWTAKGPKKVSDN